VLRHSANKATTHGGADNGTVRLGELSAPAARQEGHPSRGRTHGGIIETQLVVTPPIGKSGGGSRHAGQRLLDEHAAQRCWVTNSARASAKHEHRVQLSVVGEVGRWRAVRHAAGSSSNLGQRFILRRRVSFTFRDLVMLYTLDADRAPPRAHSCILSFPSLRLDPTLETCHPAR
jgi:hypothetical protein